MKSAGCCFLEAEISVAQQLLTGSVRSAVSWDPGVSQERVPAPALAWQLPLGDVMRREFL